MTFIDEAQPAKPGMRAKIVEEYKTLAGLHGAQEPFLEIMHGPRQNAISLSPFLAGRERHVLVRGGETASIDGVAFHKGDANDMSGLFEDECFATVIWDRALEHDPFFWLTLAEIKRVLMPGGLLMVCTPGFGKSNKFGIQVTGAKGNALPFMTATSAASTSAADYWRISPQTMRKVILDGFDVRELRMPYMVPHVFGVGVKPV